MVNIDATNLVMGRVASFAAKKALEGEEVNVLNAEKAIISGRKKQIFAKYKSIRDKGGPHHGPFFPTKPDLILKRTIRGMLPHKRVRGRDALKKVRVYIGIPKEFEGKNLETIKKANKNKFKLPKFTTVEELAKWLGGKW